MKNTKIATFLIGLSAILVMDACSSSKSSSTNGMNMMIARMQIDEPIEGVCDTKNVIVVLPIPGNGQVKAVAPKTEEELTTELNAKVTFLHDNPDHEDKGMVNLIINCKGELVRCQIDNKTKSSDLDRQIVAVFAEMKKWTPGLVNNKPYDTAELYSFTIKKGKISVE